MNYLIRPIIAADDAAIATLIRQVGLEFGAVGEGFGPSDAEVAAMSRHYGHDGRSLYLVAEQAGTILGGVGIAPLGDGGTDDKGVCELKKLFLLPAARGRGIGRSLVEASLAFAVQAGYQQCYLDTLGSMAAAIALYRQLGFEHLDGPLDASIHGGCDVWMLKSLG